MFKFVIICLGIISVLSASSILRNDESDLSSLLKNNFDNFDILSILGGAQDKEEISEMKSGSIEELIRKEYELYKIKFSKIHKSLEENENRLAIYRKNVLKVKEHNERFQKGLVSYSMKINHMSDWTEKELNKGNGFIPNKFSGNGSSYIPLNLDSKNGYELPSEIDWRDKGAVTPVKNQGHCGSCYAFSATGALEGQVWRKTGKLISLSAQQIVDCDDLDKGCRGGVLEHVFDYIKEAGGVMSEISYPYVSGETRQPNIKCSFKKSEVKATDTGYLDVESDERQILEVVATRGPVSAAIHATEDFHLIGTGIYYDKECTLGKLNHGVLIVGYGTDEASGTPFWIIKNTYGTNFGDNGYFRMPRNVNACRISEYVVLPLI